MQEPNTHEAHIWSINMDQVTIKTLQHFYNTLSTDEQQRVSKFKFVKDRTTFAIARASLRTLSGKYLNMDPKEIKFHYGKFGKPQFHHTTSLKFNVSHSGNNVIIGFVQDYDVGVDVEEIKDNPDLLDIAKQFFSKSEVAALEEIPTTDRYNAFYRCWTRKEAFIKAKGNGLSYPLDSFSVSLDHNSEAKLESLDSDPKEKSTWNMFSFKPHENYIAAMAVQGNVNAFKVMEWS